MSRIESYYLVLEDRNEERKVVRNDDALFSRCSLTDKQRFILRPGGEFLVYDADGFTKYKKVYKALDENECNEVKAKSLKGTLAIFFEQAKKFNKPEEFVISELFGKFLTGGTNFIFAYVDKHGFSHQKPCFWDYRDTSTMIPLKMLVLCYANDAFPTQYNWVWRYSRSTKHVRRASFNELMRIDTDGAYLLGSLNPSDIYVDSFGTIYFKKYYNNSHRIEGIKFFLSTMEKNLVEDGFLG